MPAFPLPQGNLLLTTLVGWCWCGCLLPVFLLPQEAAAAATTPFRLSLHRTTAVPPVVAILEEEPQRQSRKHKDNTNNEENETPPPPAEGATDGDEERYQYGGYYGGYYYNYYPPPPTTTTTGNGATAATATAAPSTVPTSRPTSRPSMRPTKETSEDGNEEEDATTSTPTVAPFAPPLPGDNDQDGATTTQASPPPTATPPNNAASNTLPPGTVQANPPSSDSQSTNPPVPPKRPTRPPSPFGFTSQDDNDTNNEEDSSSSSSNNDNTSNGNTLPPGFVQANPNADNTNGSVEEDLPPPPTTMPTVSPAPTPMHDSCRAAQAGQVFTTRVSQSVPMDYEVLYVIDEDSDATTAASPPQYWAPQFLDEPFRQYLALTLVDCALADASPIQGMDVALASTPVLAEPCQRIQFFEDTQYACRRMQSTMTVYLSEDSTSSMTTLEVQDAIYTTLRTAMNGPTYRRRLRQLFVSDFTNPDEGIMDLYLLNVPSTDDSDNDTPPLNALERDSNFNADENAKLGQAASASIMGVVFLALGVLGLVWFRRGNHNNNDQSTILSLHKTTVSSQAQSFDDQDRDHYRDGMIPPPMSPITRRGGPFVLPLQEVRTAHAVPPCTPSQLSAPEGMPAAADGDHHEGTSTSMDYPATSLFEAYEASPIHNPHPEVEAEEGGEQLFYRTVTTGYPIPPKIRSHTQEIGTVRRQNPARRYDQKANDDELVAVPPPFLHASRSPRGVPADPPVDDNDNKDTSVFSVTGFLNGHCAAMEGFYDPDQDPLLFCCDHRKAADAASSTNHHHNPKALLPKNYKTQTKKTSPTSAMELEWDASPVRPSLSFRKQQQQTKSRTSVHLWAQQCGYEHSNGDDEDDDDDYYNSSHKEEEAESRAPTSYFHNFSPYGKEEPEDTSLASSAKTMKKMNHRHILSSRSPDPSVRMGNVSTSTHHTSSRRRRQDATNSSSRLAATAATRRSPHYDGAAKVDVEENDEDYYRYQSSSSSSSSEDRYNYTSSSSRSMGQLRSSSRGRARRQSHGSTRGDSRGRPTATAQHPVYALDTIAL